MLRVYLGRFAPFHEGHKMLLSELINKFGVENCLVLIGSTNVLNGHTPYTYEERLKMVNNDFPKIRALPIEDVADDDTWLKSVQKLEKELGDKFVFYGGSEKDLEILSRRFETHVLVDRFTEGKGINATAIREKLRKEGKLST